MKKNNKLISKQDLTWASEIMRNEHGSEKQRRIAAQDLANHRWEQEYKRQLGTTRSANASRKISSR